MACWNVRTMQDSENSDRPHRRSALVARELARLDIDIAALSEVRFAEQGTLVEHGAGYTLFWSGKGKDERRLSGVGFMIKNNVANRLQSLPVGHSDRLMSLRLPLKGNQFLTIISVYAPTLLAEPMTKEAFYRDLRELVLRIDKDDKLLIMGDFNARVGRDFEVWNGVLGRHGVGNCNENGRLLLGFCAEIGLTVTNTLFQQKDRFKTTRRHPRSKHWHLLDYILVRQKDASDVTHTRVMTSADCYTDHRLVRAKLRLAFKPMIRTGRPNVKKLQVDKLSLKREEFQEKLKTRFSSNPNTENEPVNQWEEVKTVLYETAAEVAGFSTRKHQDWFDENDTEIQELLKLKRACHEKLLTSPEDQTAKAAYRAACHNLQSKLRVMENSWWLSLAEKTQLYAKPG